MKYISRSFATEDEAKAWRAKTLTERNTGALVVPTKVTVGEFINEWVAKYADVSLGNLAPKTTERYQELLRVHVTPRIGTVKLADLSPLHLQSVYATVRNAGRSAKTALHVHRLLHRILEAAVKWGYVARNVADAVEAPRPERQEVKVPGEEELARLLDTLKPTRYYVPTLIALGGGLRRGEILALKWENVDLDAARLRVVESLEQTKTGVGFKSPKSARGRRVVDLPAFLVDALRQHRDMQTAEKAVLGGDFHDHGLVVSRENGDVWPPDLFSGSWWKVVRAAGFALRFHDLRHAHASLLLQGGIHLKVTQERLGHSSIAITSDLYSHVAPSLQRDAADKIDEALRRIGGGGR